MTVDAQLGLAPWDVLAQGISKQTTLTFGYATVAVSILVLIAWIPLRVKPGLGSVMNAVMVGLVADLALTYIPTPDVYWQKLMLFFG